MEISTYKECIKRTKNHKLDKEDTVKMLCMGLSGEVGELIDIIKKHYFHDHDLNIQNVISEIGDIYWYLTSLANEFELDINAILKSNINKLEKRYPDGFNTENSINRIV